MIPCSNKIRVLRLRNFLCLAPLLCGALRAGPPSGYRLAWQDEFNGSTLDEAKWQYRTDTRFWSKQLPQNVSVADGVVNLHLKKESVDAVNYTAGGVISRDLFRYGYYEAAMKVPPGGGWHTSFWMMKYNRPATDTVAIELDVIENDSVTPLKYGVNVHRHLPLPHVTFGNKNITTPSLSAGFHVFACEFTPEAIRYFFDGALVQTVDATLLPHDDMNIWLTSIAAPLGGTTSVDDTQLPAVAQFDYVRFYEPFPAPSVSITSPASAAVTLADPAMSMRLEASASQPSGTPVLLWSCAEGPGTVSFADPASAETTATFSAPGHYVLLCSATNEGGTATDRVDVGVAAPTTLVLREGTRNYQHAATIIRSDYPDWNAGARDQLIVGRNSQPIRSVFSFDLSPLTPGSVVHSASLDLLTVSGSGTVGNLQLRELAATPVEGTGVADGSTGADIGAGTGAAWLTRTGGEGAADLWAAPGGDFAAQVLTEAAGFDATVTGLPVSLPSTPALVSAAQSALVASRPLDLILSATNELSGSSAFVRLSSDDDANESNRPALEIEFSGNELPSVDPGPAPAAKAGLPAVLTGNTSAADQTLWHAVSGPAAAVISDPSSPSTGVVFPAPGFYQLRFSGTNTLGTTERSLAVEAVALDPAVFAEWQQLTWSGISNPEIVAPGADPDHDSFVNLLEWALHLDAGAPPSFHPTLVKSGEMLEFSYTRRKTAPGEAVFSVEWSDDVGEFWSTVGVVTDDPVSVSPTMESVRATVPAAGGKCFVRLKVTVP